MTEAKARENRIRRAAARQGFTLEKSRTRDQRATDFGECMLLNADGGVVLGWQTIGRRVDITEVERFLDMTGDERQRERREWDRTECMILTRADIASKWGCDSETVERLTGDSGLPDEVRGVHRSHIPNGCWTRGRLEAEYVSPDGAQVFFDARSVLHFEAENPEIGEGRFDDLVARLEAYAQERAAEFAPMCARVGGNCDECLDGASENRPPLVDLP